MSCHCSEWLRQNASLGMEHTPHHSHLTGIGLSPLVREEESWLHLLKHNFLVIGHIPKLQSMEVEVK